MAAKHHTKGALMIHIVLLSGGSGTRLWPLSNNARSKQFLKVLRDEHGNPESMVQRVFRQIAHTKATVDITIAAGPLQEESIRAQIDSGYSLVIEPERRDTAPAIMLSCAYLKYSKHTDPSDTVIVMPIDTFADQEYYDRIVGLDAAVQSDFSDLVLLGVKPNRPSEKFGYILPCQSEGYPKIVSKFIEKPSLKVAAQLINEGALWNCGVFAFKLSYIDGISSQYAPVDSFGQMYDQYSALPKNSFDYEVVEKAGNVGVIAYNGTWKDLGTWNTLSDEMSDSAAGRVVLDKATCENVHVVNETGMPMVVAGLKDAVVIATPDGILASSKDASTQIKPLVNEVAETRPMYEHRRWGEYRVIDHSVFPNGAKALTKVIIISVGEQLSYQRHVRRREVWTVVSGNGEVVIDGNVQRVSCGSVINIEPMRMHAARAFKDLHIIEVQLGDQLVEEDIERFGNFWDSQTRNQ